MMIQQPFDIIHGVNYGALAIAVLYPIPVTPDQAFNLWHTGAIMEPRIHGHAKEKLEAIQQMRQDGLKWKDIAKAFGMKSAEGCHSYYSHNKKMLEENEG